jgi:GH24 family phage-related lysozyme (muramidase)
LREHAEGLSQCVNIDLPENVQAALVSWTYNVGVNAACGSTLVRLLNQGDIVGACNQLPRWNIAGGKVVRGLTNRRMAEMDVCLNGWPD